MNRVRDYREDAKANEEVFRNILRGMHPDHLKAMELDPEALIDEIFEKYSMGNRYGIWTILDFRMGPHDDPLETLAEDEALFSAEDIACLSGQGSTQKYKVRPDGSVEFDSNILSWRS